MTQSTRKAESGSSKGCSANNIQRPGSLPLLIEAEQAPLQNCHRLVMLGSAKVGKTAIVNRFLNNKFNENYTPTIEDFHRKIYRIRGEAYRLDLLDTSGNNPFPAMRRLLLLTGDLFILVYSVDNRNSFDEVRDLCRQIIVEKYESEGGGGGGISRRGRKDAASVPIVIVGNKCDRSAEYREVDTSELRCLADNCGRGCACLEVSAKKDINIEEIFLKLFMIAQLPTEMSPSMHRKVQPNYVGSGSPRGGSLRRSLSLRRRLSDACGAIAPNVRRPSIRTDLLLWRTKQSLTEKTTECAGPQPELKCSIQ